MVKSDKKINHTFDDYDNLISNLQNIIKIILLELRTIVKEHKDIYSYTLSQEQVSDRIHSSIMEIETLFGLFDFISHTS